MKQFLCTLSLVLCVAAAPAMAADVEVHSSIQEALNELYNFDFKAAHKTLDAHIADKPEDPIGPGVRASAYLFYELDRLAILEYQFFEDDDNISDKKKLDPDQDIRTRLFAALEETETLAQAELARDPKNVNALFALCLKEGVLTDYKALVEKKGIGSLKNAKASNKWAVRLLEIEPNFYDAYLTTGVNEYLIGSLPFFVKWFVKMDGIKGSKKQAFANLELVADKGQYLGPFAKILLSIISLREEKPERAKQLLAELSDRYPQNPLLKKELARVTEKLAKGEL
jgi:hypothetical protein